MAIKKTFRPTGISAKANRPMGRRPVTASTSITSGIQNRQARRANTAIKANFAGLTPEQAQFARQITNNCRTRASIMGATNTSNIAARPDFLELLPSRSPLCSRELNHNIFNSLFFLPPPICNQIIYNL